MRRLILVIGNKNYSSWSLRPWLALKQAGAEFDEIAIALRRPETPALIKAHSPTGRVPVLRDGDVTIWESLAICEYVAELFPQAGLWPDDRAARGVCRAVATEMHGGFADLRSEMPMDYRARIAGRTPSAGARADIERVTLLWREARARFGAGGPFLFGRFSVADCMYAPVVTRFQTYGVALDPTAAAYRDAVLALPAMKAWLADAVAEPELGT
jgi:glutathione S-transferase